MVNRHTAEEAARRQSLADASTLAPTDPSPYPPTDPAQHRRCEVYKEPGADVATRMMVADSGGSQTSYAHRGCAEATGASEVRDGAAWAPLAPTVGATGGCRVALYACISDGRDPKPVMDELRTYASARDWTVTAAVYDTGPLDRTTDRYALARVARLLEDGAIDGIVARSEADVAASTKLGRARLDGLERPAFVDYLHKGAEVVSP
ncbi:hypothetical protein [Streptomyces sp. NPDC023838]|uniref:hypothetical protein n=1 Tax=Streptomyces sp. NPDC023838 TaxID=3154325 RepID=UPI0034015F50